MTAHVDYNLIYTKFCKLLLHSSNAKLFGAGFKSKMDGRLFQFTPRDKNLLAFMSLNAQSKPCSNALVFIAGQTDGFLSLNYSVPLAGKLATLDYSLIQVNLGSSFLQFGFKCLQTDSEDLTDLVSHIEEKYEFKKIVFMGSSTGIYSFVIAFFIIITY